MSVEALRRTDERDPTLGETALPKVTNAKYLPGNKKRTDLTRKTYCS